MDFRLMQPLSYPSEGKRKHGNTSTRHLPPNRKGSPRKGARSGAGRLSAEHPDPERLSVLPIRPAKPYRHTFTVYNLGYIGYIWHWQSFSYMPDMGVILLLYDQKHQIRFNARGSSLRFRDPTRPPSFEEYRYTHCLDKYIVLSPGETIEYHWQEYLGDFDLEKGSYSFQLRYVVPAPTDNKYSPLNRYEKAWRKNPRLKNTALFRSELNSRFYSFHLSKDIKRG